MSTSTVRIVGGLLPLDVLAGVLAGSVDGLGSNDYHLGGEPPKAAAARVWTHLLGVYRRFRDDLAKLPNGDAAVGVTRERWLGVLLTELGYGRVPTTLAGGLVVDDKAYPVSHLWGATPMHLLGWGVELDKRTPGLAGAAQRAPHAMVQELLNRNDDYLWAIVSNGRALRLLRDSTTLTGQAYVEFDLESMFDAEVFSDFVALYLLCHQSRVEVPDGGQPAQCWLERWRTTAVSQGVRALNLLRDGVQQALETLGTGFLQHPANSDLRDRLATGTIRLNDVHQSLLRVVYRLLFWAVAEDRGALLDPAASTDARARYLTHFSSSRLRRVALSRHGSAHDDLWQAVGLVFNGLARTNGEPRLGIPGLGGLFSTTSADVLSTCRLGNQPLLTAVRSLTIVQPKGQPRRQVDFEHLGAEELGSIYESLLELTPRHDPTTHAFTLETLAGNDRKTSGSYYTPTDLVELVLDTALDPVLDDAEKHAEPEAALLALRVCDPAIGSGHFMVAAARRIATRLAIVRTGEIDPTPTTVSEAMHDVVARCIYGVDLNPMAADLAKVSLWLEAMTPGKPLSFLDHHIKVGNALLGTTPALLQAGIPDDAFMALTGDDKAVVKSWKKDNTQQRPGQRFLSDGGGIDVGNTHMRRATQEVDDRSSSALTLADIAWASTRYAAELASTETVRSRRVADAWCAAFLTPKTPDAVRITQETLDHVAADTAAPEVKAAIDRLASQYRLFHWHLEFPEVFPVKEGPVETKTGWTGGFSAMLGNPPWERVKLTEQEFFASRDSDIAGAAGSAARKRAIAALESSHPDLLAEFQKAKRSAEAESQFLRGSGRFPLCGVGDVNTYSVFAEHFRSALLSSGRSGIIAPTGLVTDVSNAAYFASAASERSCAAVFDFVTNPEIWGEIGHGRLHFAVIVCTGGEPVDRMAIAFNLRHPRELIESERQMNLSAAEISLLNPRSGTLPVLRSRQDANITLSCYRRFPILVDDRLPEGTGWGLRFARLFDMTNDADSFHSEAELVEQGFNRQGRNWTTVGQTLLPLHEGKMGARYDHRAASFFGTGDKDIAKNPNHDKDAIVSPRFWVTREAVDKRFARRVYGSNTGFLGHRRVARNDDERTSIACLLPRSALSYGWIVSCGPKLPELLLLLAIYNSLIFDYCLRNALTQPSIPQGTSEELPAPGRRNFDEVPAWSVERLGPWVMARSWELTYTATDLRDVARELGDAEGPYVWNEPRRAVLQAEVDAAFLHLYGLARQDVEHVLDSFAVLNKNELREFAEFRTKRLVLAAYDAMADAAATAVPFISPLLPAPGFGKRHPAGVNRD